MNARIERIVHFAGHGDYEPTTKNAPLYSIMLSDGVLDPTTWRQMAQPRPSATRSSFSMHVTPEGHDHMVVSYKDGGRSFTTGAGGFVGAMWPLLDDAAADFAQGFYDQLSSSSKDEGGVFVADVLRDVRKRFYITGDPTYLAYAFYGNANLRVSTLSQ